MQTTGTEGGEVSTDFQATFPDEIKMTMTVTMTLAAWKEIRDAIPKEGEWGNAEVFRSEIDDLVERASKHFYGSLK